MKVLNRWRFRLEVAYGSISVSELQLYCFPSELLQTFPSSRCCSSTTNSSHLSKLGIFIEICTKVQVFWGADETIYMYVFIGCRAAAIWSSADIVHIAIYRDMSKISRYVSRYIFMVIKVMKLMIIGDIKVFIAINFK